MRILRECGPMRYKRDTEIESDWAWPDHGQLERKRPTRAPTVGGDVGVPFLQACVTGGLLGVVLAIGARAWGYAGNVAMLALVIGIVIAALAWLALLGQHRALLWTIETWASIDIDQDGHKGKPEERVIILDGGKLKAEAVREAAALDRASFVSDFARFVKGLAIKGTALRAWQSTIGRDKYQEYRDLLLAHGLARWKNDDPRQGWELVATPESILARLRE
jgi:hypothetical protein